jgi:predicted nucleic-acid-binding protein
MIAIDTNILARYLLNDPLVQSTVAEKLLHGKEVCTAPVTVFLELVWVLESYDCQRAEIVKALRLLFGVENFKPQHIDALAYALRWYEGGMDFGDALHLALSPRESKLKTFDKGFVKAGARLEAHPVVEQP